MISAVQPVGEPRWMLTGFSPSFASQAAQHFPVSLMWLRAAREVMVGKTTTSNRFFVEFSVEAEATLSASLFRLNP